jgi:DNA helicase-2/ATP-dependent DNA helicase PcrA
VEEALTAVEEDAEPCSLEAAARRLLPAMAPKARKGMEEFLSLMEEGRTLLAGTAARGAGKTATRKSTAGERTAAQKTAAGGKASAKGTPRRTTAQKTAAGGLRGTPEEGEEDSPEDLRGAEGLSVLVVKLVKDSGLADYHRFHDEIGAVQRLNNLQELANAASEYSAGREGLLQFLENIELDRSLGDKAENKNGENQVTLITFHNTKGLEFRRVIMTGLEQGIFPRDNKEGEDLEEERRLFYVGATRAIDELYLTSCAWRRIYGRTQSAEPSLFLREIDSSVLRILGKAPFGFSVSPGSGGGTQGGAGDETWSGKRGEARGGSRHGKDLAESGWQRGDRVYHDDYGYGGVAAVRESEEGPVVELLFESGKTLRFLSSSQGRSLTKIGKDY